MFLCVLCVLCGFISSCSNETERSPQEYGYFVLYSDNARSVTTIKPPDVIETNVPATSKLILIFTKGADTETRDLTWGTRETLITLPVGTYSLTATLYNDDDKPYLQGTLSTVPITAGVTYSPPNDIDLLPIINTGTGLFDWKITVPSGLTSAQMRIENIDIDGSLINIFDIADNAVTNPVILNLTPPFESQDVFRIDSGSYIVHITLIKSASEIYNHSAMALHIYQNMTSSYAVTFTDSVFANSPANPFLITSPEELSYVGRGSANPAPYKDWTNFAYYKLASDIDLSGTPYESLIPLPVFYGEFDGDDHTIIGIKITGTGNGAMFGVIDTDAVVSNVRFLTFPTGLEAAEWQTLSTVMLDGYGSSNVAGLFSWDTPSDSVGNAGSNLHSMTFTPDDTTIYNAVTQNVNVTVKASLVDMVNISGVTNWSVNGSNPAGRTATLTAFTMGKYEVTQEQWFAVMGYNPSYYNGTNGREPTAGEVQSKRPVDNVTWFDAIEFCNKLSEQEGLQPVYTITGRTPTGTGYPITAATVTADWTKNGYRLPTEVEWQYAAQSGISTPYIATLENAWYVDNSNHRTHQVGLKEPNDWSLYDILGNVAEWCWDWYNATNYPYQNNSTNPTGYPSGSGRIRRGGGRAEVAPMYCNSEYRDSGAPSGRTESWGFRVVRPN